MEDDTAILLLVGCGMYAVAAICMIWAWPDDAGLIFITAVGFCWCWYTTLALISVCAKVIFDCEPV